MDLDALGNIGEFVGGLGVVVTLAYLGLQIRQNTRTVRASYHQAASDSVITIQCQLASDAELGEIFRRGQVDRSTLSEKEIPRFNYIMAAFTRIIETQHSHYARGLIDAEQWARYLDTLRVYAGRPGFVEWWQSRNIPFRPGFSALVDKTITGTPAD